MSPSAAVWLTDVFLIVFVQQQRFMAQRNKIYQALNTHIILVSRIDSLLVLVFSWDLTITKTEYPQPHPLTMNVGVGVMFFLLWLKATFKS